MFDIRNHEPTHEIRNVHGMSDVYKNIEQINKHKPR